MEAFEIAARILAANGGGPDVKSHPSMGGETIVEAARMEKSCSGNEAD